MSESLRHLVVPVAVSGVNILTNEKQTNRPIERTKLPLMLQYSKFFYFSFISRGKKLLPCQFHGRKYMDICRKRKCLSRKYYISHKKRTATVAAAAAKQTTKQAFAKDMYSTHKIFLYTYRCQNSIKYHKLVHASCFHPVSNCEICEITIMVYVFVECFLLSFSPIPSRLLFIYFFFFDLQSLPFTQSTPCDK